MNTSYGWKIVAPLSGIISLVSLFLPVVSINASAFGFEIASSELTLLNIADMASTVGESPDGIYLIMAVIAVGALLSVISITVHYAVAVLGALVQTSGAGILLYSIYSEGIFVSFNALGVEAGISPSIGLFGLIIASVLGLSTLAL